MAQLDRSGRVNDLSVGTADSQAKNFRKLYRIDARDRGDALPRPCPR